MAFSSEPQALAQGIQLAIAPVFLLTAISALLGVLAGRLARIVDRVRMLNERLDKGAGHETLVSELEVLARRGHLVNAALALLTVAAVLISITVVVLFVSEVSHIGANVLVAGSFLSGLACFVAALLCFLIETRMATHTLKFQGRK